MSTKLKLTNITKAEIKAKGVVSLADRPNSQNSYGVSGLTAANLKLWFDKLATYLADKINEINDALNNNGENYIGINGLGDDIQALSDLTASFLDGSFADILQLYQSAEDVGNTDNLKGLQTIISNLSKLIADDTENLANLQASFLDGSFASLLLLYQTAAEMSDVNNLKDLQTIITSLSALIEADTADLSNYKNTIENKVDSADSALQNNIDNAVSTIEKEAGYSLDVSLSSSTLTITLKNKAGTVICKKSLTIVFTSGATAIGLATEEDDGLMSAEDKAKLDELANSSVVEYAESLPEATEDSAVIVVVGSEIYFKVEE
ncbi:MAG: hypothetical protein LUD19_06520 [Clostridia bacterium]|nr:hypothetical protein [Clostridia bacterium]